MRDHEAVRRVGDLAAGLAGACAEGRREGAREAEAAQDRRRGRGAAPGGRHRRRARLGLPGALWTAGKFPHREMPILSTDKRK